MAAALLFGGSAAFAAYEGQWPETELRVELRPPAMVMLSAPVGGRLEEVLVEDGQEVKKGQLMVRVYDRLYSLRLDAAKAARDQAAAQLRVAEKLYELGSRGALDVALAQAQLDGAQAEALMAEEMVNLCQLRAPFDGRVTQLEVKAQQHVPEGAPLLELAEAGPVVVEFMMPSSWLTLLKPGSSFQVRVDETGRLYPAELLRLGGKVDPLTQSIRVYARLSDPAAADELLPGMTGTVVRPGSEPSLSGSR